MAEQAVSESIRLPAEERNRAELEALREADTLPRPPGWRLSPRMVETFVLGSREEFRTPAGATIRITPKYLGDRCLVQVAIATLASDRALLLVGDPGTAKSWLSEHLAAAICGTSRYLVQGTAGTTEDQVKYSWNYALLLAEGPSERAPGAQPDLPGDGRGPHRALRGAHPLRLGDPGHHDLHPLREGDSGAGAEHRSSRPGAASTSSPPPTPGTAASTT